MDSYEVLGTVGYGSFGKVARICRKSDNKPFVWKELDYGRMSEKEKQLIVSEVNILRAFKHPYIVKYYDRVIDRDAFKIYIIMEYCDQGDLAALIKRNRQMGVEPEERLVWRMAMQLCLALEQCHRRKEGKILHRDIKPANIFLDKDYNVKLGDFGLARVMSETTQFAHSNVGTPYYMSPEQINDQAYDEKSDIWSLGCVLYEFCTNRPPFEANSHLSLALKIKAGRIAALTTVSSELASLVTSCLLVDPVRRPNIDNLLNSPSLSTRLKEKKLSNHYHELKKKEEELSDREASIREREHQLTIRERIIEEREYAILVKEREKNEFMLTPERDSPPNSYSTPNSRGSKQSTGDHTPPYYNSSSPNTPATLSKPSYIQHTNISAGNSPAGHPHSHTRQTPTGAAALTRMMGYHNSTYKTNARES